MTEQGEGYERERENSISLSYPSSEAEHTQQLFQGLQSYLGIFAFALLMKIRHPDNHECAAQVGKLIDDWKRVCKEKGGTNVYTEDEDVRKILESAINEADIGFQNALDKVSSQTKDAILHLIMNM